MEEKERTLTGVEKKYVNKHKEILERRLSYLTERYTLRQNSFDGAECSALRHVIWLITLELTDGLTLATPTNKVLTDEKTSRTDLGRETNTGKTKPTSVILRPKNKDNG